MGWKGSQAFYTAKYCIHLAFQGGQDFGQTRPVLWANHDCRVCIFRPRLVREIKGIRSLLCDKLVWKIAQEHTCILTNPPQYPYVVSFKNPAAEKSCACGRVSQPGAFEFSRQKAFKLKHITFLCCLFRPRGQLFLEIVNLLCFSCILTRHWNGISAMQIISSGSNAV